MVAISELLQGCLAQFLSLINSGALSDHIEEVPLQEWTDELGRLRVWAANIGAHQTRQSSLDYRLRDASHISSQIVRLLEQFQELLTDLKDVLEEKSDDEAEDDKFEGLGDSESEIFTEIQEIHQGLVETINQLYQMSMIIRKPAEHDRLVGTKKVDSEPFQFWAKQHVSNKYPNADALAIDRISSAMARQRAILKYRERHHAKLSQGIDSKSDSKSAILSETVVTDLFKEVPGQFSDMASDAGVSETSYGGTLLEGTGADAPKIPPIPKIGIEHRPFECPYCFYIITVRDRRAWAHHIFRDLMPYVCIFPGCSVPNKLYGSRRQWHHHIEQTHATTTSTDSTYDCSICRQCSLPAVTFQRHVGKHLEELALFLLPRTDSDADENKVTDENLTTISTNIHTLEQSAEQRDDMENVARSASDSYISDDNFPLKGPRNKNKHYPSSVGANLSDRESLGDLGFDVEDKMRASSTPYSREYDELAMREELEYEEDIFERLRGLFKREQQSAEEAKAEGGYQLKRLVAKRAASQEEAAQYKLQEKLTELERREEEEEREKISQEIRDEHTRSARVAEEKRKKELSMKAAAIEEWQQHEKERIKQKKEQAEKKDKEFSEQLYTLGYTEKEVEKILLHRKRNGQEGEEKRKEHAMEGKKTTWIKVHRKHLVPETLIAFNLPWDWDERDTDYIIIKQWVDDDLQEELFAHTRRVRKVKLDGQISSPTTGRKFDDRMYLVRKKSPNRERSLGTWKIIGDSL